MFSYNKLHMRDAKIHQKHAVRSMQPWHDVNQHHGMQDVHCMFASCVSDKAVHHHNHHLDATAEKVCAQLAPCCAVMHANKSWT